MLYMMQIFFLLMMGIGQTTQEQFQFQRDYVDHGRLPKSAPAKVRYRRSSL